MEQLTFFQLLSVDKKVSRPPRTKRQTKPEPINHKWVLMAQGLKRDRLGIIDREEFLIEQIERMNFGNSIPVRKD